MRALFAFATLMLFVRCRRSHDRRGSLSSDFRIAGYDLEVR